MRVASSFVMVNVNIIPLITGIVHDYLRKPTRETIALVSW